MDWYKHSTGSHDDPDVSDAMDEFGHVGYSVFFITLEIYGSEFNHLDAEGWLTISKRFLARKLRLSQTKVEQILNFYSERQRIITKTTKNTISINCPKFVDIASNWTRRRNSLPTEALQRPYVAPTAIEEEKKKKRREEDIIPPPVDDKSPTCPHEEIISLYHKILPELPAVKIWTQKRQGYLRSRWKESAERQCLEWWEKYFLKIKQSPFLTGNVTDFKASLEWVVNQSNMVKILEGKYDGGNGNGRTHRNFSDDKRVPVQDQIDADLARANAAYAAAKAAAARRAGGTARDDDAPDFQGGGI